MWSMIKEGLSILFWHFKKPVEGDACECETIGDIPIRNSSIIKGRSKDA